ncbi:hypothetical protein HYC85_016438 [Camellia sinensis]|uniref:Uncharacterized protein n=1 Tax=Camellia sinensis TaxID=4442 RepID=A0A7J7GZW4_CAMSI|nr:hypothetical protein HYC85_016438 [Camellia sinensis]
MIINGSNFIIASNTTKFNEEQPSGERCISKPKPERIPSYRRCKISTGIEVPRSGVSYVDVLALEARDAISLGTHHRDLSLHKLHHRDFLCHTDKKCNRVSCSSYCRRFRCINIYIGHPRPCDRSKWIPTATAAATTTIGTVVDIAFDRAGRHGVPVDVRPGSNFRDHPLAPTMAQLPPIPLEVMNLEFIIGFRIEHNKKVPSSML